MLVALGRGGDDIDGSKPQPGTAGIEHFLGPTGTTTGDTQLSYLEKRIQIADTTGCLDLYVRGRMLAHQRQVVESGTARTIACAGFDPIGVQVATDLAKPNLVFVP